MAQNNNPNILKEAAKGTLRGAASGGGLIGSVAGGVQAGFGTAGRINAGFKNFRKKQEQVSKPKFRKKVANPTPKPSAPKPKTPIKK